MCFLPPKPFLLQRYVRLLERSSSGVLGLLDEVRLNKKWKTLIFDLSRIFKIVAQSDCFSLFPAEYLLFISFPVMSTLVPPMTDGRKKGGEKRSKCQT